ncbi:MAG: class I SAM-dependent methyltransferase [Patescibacteria group bacterium]|nr:class I SAM-dependent methyltransferase [Patescibacteria group bacterium]
MKREVDKLEFWKERLDTAPAGYPHYSVYVANTTLWKFIEKNHQKIIKQHMTVKDKVLDAGCGYGRASEFLPADYTGVDFSPDFINKAKELYPDKAFIQADLKQLPFADNSFDWAVCISIRHMIVGNLGQDAWLPMQQELKRVAKKVLILEYEDSSIYEIL